MAEIELNQKQREVAELEEQQRITELNNSKQHLTFVIIGLLLFSLIVYLLFLLKRKEKQRKNIQVDQASHLDQLSLLSVDNDTLKHLFLGFQSPFICFDSTGTIHHHAKDMLLSDNGLKMQQNFPDIWQMVLPHLDQDEKLETDLFVDLDLPEAEGIWVHQMPFLDDMLVCLPLGKENQQADGLKHAENIRKYSDFKQQLSNFIVNSKAFPIHKATQLNQAILAMKTINNAKVPISPRMSQSEFKSQLVDLMITCIDIWQKSTKTTSLELAEKSGLWLVSIEEGHLRTRTMNRYTDIKRLPSNPRWKQVVKTAHFILSNCDLSINDRQLLNRKTELLKQVIRNRATNYS